MGIREGYQKKDEERVMKYGRGADERERWRELEIKWRG